MPDISTSDATPKNALQLALDDRTKQLAWLQEAYNKKCRLIERAAELLSTLNANSNYETWRLWNEQRDQWLKDAGVEK
jgi:LPS O-antigen subunit length determinant protein (WzzB/FepE family)